MHSLYLIVFNKSLTVGRYHQVLLLFVVCFVTTLLNHYHCVSVDVTLTSLCFLYRHVSGFTLREKGNK